MMTESKLWRNYLKAYIRAGFRIETSTMQGVPDVFAVLPSGRPVWIELKILLTYLRPGQATFRDDYNPSIPCIVLGAVETAVSKGFVADIYGVRRSSTETNWQQATFQIIEAIEQELFKRDRSTHKVKRRSIPIIESEN